MGDSINKQYLLKKFMNGSQEAFEEFYDSYSRFVYTIALKTLKNHQEAEDICHDVFIEISKHPDRYSPERGSLEAWLAVKTRSRCLDLLRKKREILSECPGEDFQVDSYQEPIEEKVILNMEKKAVLLALEDLPKPQQEVIYWGYFRELTHKEMAHQLKRPLGTIKSLVRYGIKNLRKQLLRERIFQSSHEEGDHHGM